MLGQPMSMLIPRVVGFKLIGELREGATATDLVLTVTERLREHGVVGQFVEFYGAGDRATCRSPTARRSATCRRSSARPARSSRSTPRRCATSSSPAARPSTSSASRPTPRRRACGTTRTRGADVLRDARARPRRGRPVARRPEAPAGPRLADRGQARRSGWRSTTCCRPTHTEADEGSEESFPASDPPATNGDSSHDRRPEPAGQTQTGGVQVADRVSEIVAADARRRHRDRARPRPRRDRGDHVVHEHVEPVGDDRRRPARAQRGRARPAVQAVGQDVARARARRSSWSTTTRRA